MTTSKDKKGLEAILLGDYVAFSIKNGTSHFEKCRFFNSNYQVSSGSTGASSLFTLNLPEPANNIVMCGNAIVFYNRYNIFLLHNLSNYLMITFFPS